MILKIKMKRGRHYSDTELISVEEVDLSDVKSCGTYQLDNLFELKGFTWDRPINKLPTVLYLDTKTKFDFDSIRQDTIVVKMYRESIIMLRKNKINKCLQKKNI